MTHIMVFNKTPTGTNLRIGRTPRGPTLTFRVNSYSLVKDIANSLKRPKSPGTQFKTAPLLVLNNFAGDDVATRLITKTFQNMFPSINVANVDLKALRRVLLINRDSETGKLDIRHYEIAVKPTGLSKSVKQLLRTDIPDLSKFDDISSYILRGGDGYESDASDLEGSGNKVELPQTVAGAGNTERKQSAVRLTELGPRMELSLLKIEEGFCEGEVLYHSYIKLTEAEKDEKARNRKQREQLKAQRKAIQAQNIRAKEHEKEALKKRTMRDAKKPYATLRVGKNDEDSDAEGPDSQVTEALAINNDDAAEDIEWYKKEVGEAPDADLFKRSVWGDGLYGDRVSGVSDSKGQSGKSGRGRGRGAQTRADRKRLSAAAKGLLPGTKKSRKV